ncbi:xanthine dehydrogenase family protein molybdopterin-binding subunit, partial [Roseateles sp. GG27B]
GGDGVVVIADGYWPAKQGREALKLEWDASAVEKVDSVKQLAQYRQLATQPGPRKYDADVSALAAAEHKINAEFVFPY